MDLELETIVCVGIVTILLVPVLWLRIQKSNQSQPKYKKVITMMAAVLLVVHVILCIRDYKEHKKHSDTCDLGMRILEITAPVAFCILFMVVRRASLKERKYKLAIMIMGGMVMLVFAAIFLWKSAQEYLPDWQNFAYLDIGPRRKLTQISCVINSKGYDPRKILTKIFFFALVALCVSLGV